MKRCRIVISTEYSQEKKVSRVLADLDVSCQIVRNRRQITILPEAVNKATCLSAALKRFKLTDCDVVAVGNAENDIELLQGCGCGVAVKHAVPQLKKVALFVMPRGMGAGVVELIDHL